jgi:hypothetical protein
MKLPKLKKRLRNYHCSACDQTVKRMSDKYWLMSMCDASGFKMARLTLVNKPKINYLSKIIHIQAGPGLFKDKNAMKALEKMVKTAYHKKHEPKIGTTRTRQYEPSKTKNNGKEKIQKKRSSRKKSKGSSL